MRTILLSNVYTLKDIKIWLKMREQMQREYDYAIAQRTATAIIKRNLKNALDNKRRNREE